MLFSGIDGSMKNHVIHETFSLHKKLIKVGKVIQLIKILKHFVGNGYFIRYDHCNVLWETNQSTMGILQKLPFGTFLFKNEQA